MAYRTQARLRVLFMPILLTALLTGCGDDDEDAKPDASVSRPDAAAISDSSVMREDASGRDAAQSDAATGDASLPDRIVIAEGQAAPSGIAVDDEFVYFANRDAGTIVRCPLEGCGSNSKVLVDAQDHPISVAVDGTRLYWVNGHRQGDTGNPTSRPVFSCKLPDCNPESIEAFDQGTYQPYGISVVADRVYLAAWPSLVACPKTGCSGATVMLAGGSYVSSDADESFIYAALIGQGMVHRCPLAGCTADPPIATGLSPMSVVADAESLYIADYDFFRWNAPEDAGIDEGQILRCPLTGCGAAGPMVIESGDISPYALAEHGDRLYFTNIDHGTVVSIKK